MPLTHERDGQNAQAQNCPQDNFVFNPEKRPLIKQNIAQGAATKGCQKTHHTHTDHVHAFARSLHNSGQSKCQSCEQFNAW
jgi:hypothetical protein